MEKQSYITGFIDGEGCFSISFTKRKKLKLGIEVRPSFAVAQHRRNKSIILFLAEYFGCGGVRYSKRDQNYKFEVRSVNDLVNKVIPHFDKYPLMTTKKDDYEAFKRICLMTNRNHHLSKDGLKMIIELSKKVNKTGNKKFKRHDLLKSVAR